MVVKQIVHSPEINEFDWTVLHNCFRIAFEEQYSNIFKNLRKEYTPDAATLRLHARNSWNDLKPSKYIYVFFIPQT